MRGMARFQPVSCDSMTPKPPSKAWLARLSKLDTRKGREEENLFLAEGWKIVRECFAAGLRCDGLLVSEPEVEGEDLKELLAMNESDRFEVFTLSESQFQKAASTRNPQGILGVFERPAPHSLEVLSGLDGIVVVLDQVQDPGNVGTAIRCAAGLGSSAVALTEGCADLWNPKTLRATAGSVFHIPCVASVPRVLLVEALKADLFKIWIADSQGAPVTQEPEIPQRLAIVFGNESRGAGRSWTDIVDFKKVGLPLARGVESLNVGTAVAAMLATIRR